jgi:hypothetical protein
MAMARGLMAKFLNFAFGRRLDFWPPPGHWALLEGKRTANGTS